MISSIWKSKNADKKVIADKNRNRSDKKIKKSVKTYTMTPYLEKVVAEAQRDFAVKKNISPGFSNVSDAIAWLNKQ